MNPWGTIIGSIIAGAALLVGGYLAYLRDTRARRRERTDEHTRDDRLLKEQRTREDQLREAIEAREDQVRATIARREDETAEREYRADMRRLYGEKCNDFLSQTRTLLRTANHQNQMIRAGAVELLTATDVEKIVDDYHKVHNLASDLGWVIDGNPQSLTLYVNQIQNIHLLGVAGDVEKMGDQKARDMQQAVIDSRKKVHNLIAQFLGLKSVT